jgi:hypothetical protein
MYVDTASTSVDRNQARSSGHQKLGEVGAGMNRLMNPGRGLTRSVLVVGIPRPPTAVTGTRQRRYLRPEAVILGVIWIALL